MTKNSNSEFERTKSNKVSVKTIKLIDYLLVRSHHTGWFMLGIAFSMLNYFLPIYVVLPLYLLTVILTLRADLLIHPLTRTHSFRTHKKCYQVKDCQGSYHPAPIIHVVNDKWNNIPLEDTE